LKEEFITMLGRKMLLMFFVIFLGVNLSARSHAGDASSAEYLSDTLSDCIISATYGWGEFGLNTSASASSDSAMKLRIGEV
jgi:hypothetical protein